MSHVHRWAVFISGQGSNLQVLLDHPELADVKVVVSNRSNAYGLERAQRHLVPTKVFNTKESWLDLSKTLREDFKVESIFLLGFMRIVPPEFIREWSGRILNLHPSLLPLFPGLNAIEKSFAERAPMGVTVHHVIDELDAGPIVKQKILYPTGVPPGVGLDSATEAIHQTEHELVLEVIKQWR